MDSTNIPTSRFRLFLMATSIVVALSGCSGGGPRMALLPLPMPLPAGHNLPVGEITVTPGTSEEHGNVVVSCPADGKPCVINVDPDGSIFYERPGGMPTFVAAVAVQALPAGHGLAAGVIEVAAGASEEHGNVVVTCPAGGEACVLTVNADGTGSYEKTGGMPAFFDTLVIASLNGNLSEADRERVIRSMANGSYRDVVSSMATDASTGSSASVTKSRLNREPDIVETT